MLGLGVTLSAFATLIGIYSVTAAPMPAPSGNWTIRAVSDTRGGWINGRDPRITWDVLIEGLFDEWHGPSLNDFWLIRPVQSSAYFTIQSAATRVYVTKSGSDLLFTPQAKGTDSQFAQICDDPYDDFTCQIQSASNSSLCAEFQPGGAPPTNVVLGQCLQPGQAQGNPRFTYFAFLP